MAQSLPLGLVDHIGDGVSGIHSGDLSRIDHGSGGFAGLFQIVYVHFGIAGIHYGDDLQAELCCELEVSLVVSGNAHDSSRAISHEDVVGDEYGHFFVGEGIDGIFANENSRLLTYGGSTLDLIHVVDLVDVVQNGLLVLGALHVLKNCGIFRCQYHEGGAVDGVHPGGEYGEYFV